MGQTARVNPGSAMMREAAAAAQDRPREIEVGRPSHTERLTRWITEVRQKKLKCHRSPKRDFRVEAVLTNALCKAEYELRAKQLSRISRWRRLRKHLLKGVEYGSCGAYNAAERELERCGGGGGSGGGQRAVPREGDPWRGNLCEELSSLVDFLQQLGGIKSSVQR